MPTAPLETILRDPERDARFIGAFGGRISFFLTGRQSNGWLTGAHYIAPPDNGPPVHIHRNEDELLIVIEGRFAFFADGVWSEGGPGTTVFLPRGKPHAFRNIGDTDGKLYVFANPPGLETFFPECEAPFDLPDGPDMDTVIGIAARHGIEMV
ncbi:cupin domain-containing protein [Luteolibacter sp. SL250]|uniref:cupin domain-containing protein n=1 Tax=Luteolibacter sp. SL250 TaxID=2995170 RepID=UPI00226D6A43|nr:cupin domain-containing protein [Luteolibacter sp. SL250]WAC20391.1 cupin domain-containing protein [Luteolibacter sp. SL250]